MSKSTFKPGDKVIFSHPEHEDEILTLKAIDIFYVGTGPVWSVEESVEYLYQESYLRKLTKLDKALK